MIVMDDGLEQIDETLGLANIFLRGYFPANSLNQADPKHDSSFK